jgi:hypothetical protein
MSRQSLAITDEEVVAEFGRVVNLFARALPKSSDINAFCRLMNEAGKQGFTWVEALERTANAQSTLRH